MQRLAVLLIAATSVAGAALSAELEQPVPATDFVAVFEDRGSHHPWYPREALERQENGSTVMCCVPDERRRLACRTTSEQPTRRGFAREALRFANGLRLTEASYAELQQRGGQMRMELAFSLDPVQQSGDIRIETSAVCTSMPVS